MDEYDREDSGGFSTRASSYSPAAHRHPTAPPAAQGATHAALATLPGGDVKPTGHVSHACGPAAALNSPAAHAAQAAAGPVKPGAHSQVMLPEFSVVPASQAEQSAADNDPAFDRVSAGQNAQAAVPKMSHCAKNNKPKLRVDVITIAKY